MRVIVNKTCTSALYKLSFAKILTCLDGLFKNRVQNKRGNVYTTDGHKYTLSKDRESVAYFEKDAKAQLD